MDVLWVRGVELHGDALERARGPGGGHRGCGLWQEVSRTLSLSAVERERGVDSGFTGGGSGGAFVRVSRGRLVRGA